MSQVHHVVLTSGQSITSSRINYVPPGAPKQECRSRLPRYPGYLCSRQKGHRGDHAAHGTKREMFARW